VKEKEGGFKASKAPGLSELETQHPAYIEFVTALNNVMAQYENLFEGSKRIALSGRISVD
jgi:hypothetical protein